MRNSVNVLALLVGSVFICFCGSNQSDLSADGGAGNRATGGVVGQAAGGSAGQADSGSVTPVDGGSGLPCCPTGFDLYGCQSPPGGGAGLACHNPALGCASSLVCGRGCDPEVSGRCQCVDTVLCVIGDHFDPTLCKCVPDADAATPPPADAHVCVDNVLCIIGDHFDSTLCKCVPDVPTPSITCTADTDCPGGQLCGPSTPLSCPPTAMCLPVRFCVPAPCTGAACCTTATDCTGALPALCQRCGDGGTGCAHFACVAGQCDVAYCP